MSSGERSASGPPATTLVRSDDAPGRGRGVDAADPPLTRRAFRQLAAAAAPDAPAAAPAVPVRRTSVAPLPAPPLPAAPLPAPPVAVAPVAAAPAPALPVPSRSSRWRLRDRWAAFTDRRVPAPAYPATLLLPALGVAAAVGVLGAAAAPAVGPVTENLAARVMDGAETTPLAADGVTAAVTVPAGWTATPLPDASLRITSPDGVLRITVRPAAASADAEVRTLVARTGSAASVQTEIFADGSVVEHADAGGGIVAAVALTPTTSVAVTGETSGASMALYRASFAAVLARIGS